MEHSEADGQPSKWQRQDRWGPHPQAQDDTHRHRQACWPAAPVGILEGSEKGLGALTRPRATDPK